MYQVRKKEKKERKEKGATRTTDRQTADRADRAAERRGEEDRKTRTPKSRPVLKKGEGTCTGTGKGEGEKEGRWTTYRYELGVDSMQIPVYADDGSSVVS